MGVFFGGRLITSPAVASVVDDSGLANKNLTVGNVVALIGRSAGGKPKTALRFGSPDQAKAALISGELLDAVLKAFDPSAQTGSPAEVVAMRVNPALQSSLTLVDGTSANAIDLKSTDYGLVANSIKIKVEAATNLGKKLTVQRGQSYYSQDDVYRKAMSVRYTGAQATGTMTIAGNTITLQAPAGNTVATVDLTVYDSVQEVVDYINSVTGFTAAVLDGNGEKVALQGLDFVTNVDVKSALYTVRADLQACIDWINGNAEGFLDATRATGAGAPPANIGFTYLAGGTDGTVTNSDWSDCYTALQQEDVQWVVPISSDPSIHAMNDTHCSFMSTVGQMERRGIVGTAANTSDAAAITAALALNSDRTSLVHIGYYDYNSDGKLTLYPAYMTAALIAGAFASVNPGTPLTNKTIKVRGLERYLRNPTDTDQLIKGGVLCVERTKKGYKVVQSITTWLANDNYNRVEVSTGVAVDFVARNVRDVLDDLRGMKGTPILLAQAVSRVDSTLKELARAEPQGPGVITGDKANPAYKNIQAQLDGDVLRVQFECHPVIGVNYVLVSIFATAFSGSASA
jgi:hypothetical protein